jgi:phosphohistidine phosphatase SixA
LDQTTKFAIESQFMKLVLFRHGDKAFDGTNNPPLSEFGVEQAELIQKLCSDSLLPTPAAIWASPKKRAQQTMLNLAKWANLKIEIKDDLDERNDADTKAQLQKRILNTIEAIHKVEKTSPMNIYLCSHHDWVEEFLMQLPSNVDLQDHQYRHWGSAQYMVFNLNQQIFELENYNRVSLS